MKLKKVTLRDAVVLEGKTGHDVITEKSWSSKSAHAPGVSVAARKLVSLELLTQPVVCVRISHPDHPDARVTTPIHNVLSFVEDEEGGEGGRAKQK